MILPNIDIVEKVKKSEPLLYILRNTKQLVNILEGEHLMFVQEKLKDETTLVDINYISYQHYFVYSKPNVKDFEVDESLRKLGFEFIAFLKKYSTKTLQIIVLENNKADIFKFFRRIAIKFI